MAGEEALSQDSQAKPRRLDLPVAGRRSLGHQFIGSPWRRPVLGGRLRRVLYVRKINSFGTLIPLPASVLFGAL